MEFHKLKMCTLIVNEMAEAGKRRTILAFLKETEAEIVLLQETHVRKCKEWGSAACFSYA